ncbi:hypothetical protein Cgig2_005803 [Carnegiea gigantea]|uniref:SDH C-terminal domain-containing protein n=1 Tax=Carnegiea gigantea TaxID=171969 RepID=A0A9Q1KK16_9CARY|nr:hypothetical protein Cgig2_005803 [Carnegiea gigantea]
MFLGKATRTRAGESSSIQFPEKERARELANIVGGDAVSLAELESFYPEDGMILANTTSIGMQPNVDETPIPQFRKTEWLLVLQHALKHYSLVFDAVYTPKITRLLREAEQSGATIVTGVEMFIGQAYEQYERFTGLPGIVLSRYLDSQNSDLFLISRILMGLMS